MNDTLTIEAVLLARTVPEETSGGDVTICSAWWTSVLGLIRVYPLQFEHRVRAWERYELSLVRSTKDPRFRSYKLAEGSVPTFIGRHKRDEFREAFVKAATGKTIRGLNESRDSLGIIKPISVTGILERDDAPDLTHRFGRRTFGVRPRLQFSDLDGDHNLGLNEWGCYQWLRSRNPPERLWDNLRLNYPDRDQYLLVGNLRDHPTAWIVIHVIGYGARQAALFRSVPDAQRARVFARDSYRCVICSARDSLTIDHVIPRSRGGDNEPANLRTLCMAHQLQKSDRLDSEFTWQTTHQHQAVP